MFPNRKSKSISTFRVRGKSKVDGRCGSAKTCGKAARPCAPISARLVIRLLPKIHRRLQGRCITASTFRALLFRVLPPPGFGQRPWKRPSVDECLDLLRAANKKSTWKSNGIRHVDNLGGDDVSNVAGYQRMRARGRSRKLFWHEYGATYRIREVEDSGQFQVLSNSVAKVVGVLATEKTLRLKVRNAKQKTPNKNGKALLKPSAPDRALVWDFEKPYWTHGVRPRSTLSSRTLVFDPVDQSGALRPPKWSFIYLHMFSLEGSGYMDYPHYFHAGNEPVRIVLPTAPNKPQRCFEHWKEWNSRVGKYKHVRFRSWFDYLTDKVGRGENELDFATLFETRRFIHAIVDQEVKRVGDPRRVILGGASQGCCTALDAAFTYPETLAGVIGLVGHVLGATPLDPSKRSMPVHLFHETTDKEMNWQNFVGGTVQRMKSEGFNIISTRERDPCGGGHNIGHIEGMWIRRALRQITGQ